MDLLLILLTIAGAVTFAGGIILIYTIYQLTLIDAKSRGIKHPKTWGILNASGNNSNSFLLMYLIKRRKYPVKNLPDDQKLKLELYKKKALLALIFHLIAGLVFAIGLIYYLN
ncbi:hypothetical protein [Hutsoniella sourekii]|uniref:hypothetical protein n=1 Tax=Hutsoniella sourekii TaxID=87650 RepID=UPI0004856E64|nr:hypothetical protein [Hutsoniella sourekii]